MGRAISLHIGLNSVDPNQYKVYDWRRGGQYAVVVDDGDPAAEANPENFRIVDIPDGQWFRMGYRGRLKSCEYDAEDMRALAESLDFDPTVLKTSEATADRVIAAIRKAASELRRGDVFLLTYAGHGSQVDDITGDEADEIDETWCLYDRMLIDDERYALLAEFNEGVRVVVLVDCCHSGTTMRSGDTDSDGARRETVRARKIPRDAAKAIYEGRRQEYDEIQEALPDPPEPVRAEIIVISACKDDEEAADGEKNGKFTEVLKQVWAGGEFEGDYRDLHAKIVATLGTEYEQELARAGGDESKVNRQTPSFMAFGGGSESSGEDPALAAFVSQRPFTP